MNSVDLLKQIDDLVASKTFGLDALDGIKAIKDSLTKQLAETEHLSEKVRARDKEIESLKETNGWQARKIDSLTAQAKANADTVEKSQAAIYEADKHRAVAEAWKEAMQTVFRPSAVRETVWQSVPVSQHSNGVSYVNAYQQETKTTKEEL